MKKYFIPTLIVFLVLIIFGFFYAKKSHVFAPLSVSSFLDCVEAGYPVLESQRRQCKTPDGQTFTEEIPEQITYSNSSPELIVVDLPFPGAVTGKSFTLVGKARGTWFFEASFPVFVLDKDGNRLAVAIAQAQTDWMTTEFVPFKAEVVVPDSYIGPAVLVLQKDNPSGLLEHDASISFPITIEY